MKKEGVSTGNLHTDERVQKQEKREILMCGGGGGEWTIGTLCWSLERQRAERIQDGDEVQ